MRVYRYSAKHIEKATRKKKIICFGVGSNCTYVLCMTQDLGLEERIKYYVDNNSEKWGNKRKVLDFEYEIKSPDDLRNENWAETVLLITIKCYEEVLRQLQDMKLDAAMAVYISPEYRSGYDKIMDQISIRLPMKNYAVFRGEGDTCENALSVVEAWKKRGLGKYKIGWICNHPKQFMGTRKERYFLQNFPLLPHGLLDSIQYYFFLNRTKYLIYENEILPKVRKGQISCYMNHGIPLKSTKGFIQITEDTDYVLSSSDNTDLIFMEQYEAKKEQLVRCGSPRTDVLFSREEKKQLADFLHLRKYSKMLLWTPTFRKHAMSNRRDSQKRFPFGLPLIETAKDVEQLQKKLLEQNLLLVIKPHIYQDLSELIVNESGNIRVVKQDALNELGCNVYDLMKLADAMITDYSSIGFDYMLLNRPIGYSVDDMEDYKIGFSVPNPLEFMPGLHMKNVEDMLVFLQDVAVGKDEYQKPREARKKFLFQYLDGENALRLLDILGI